MSNLKSSVISGVVWQTAGRYSALIIQFIVTIILARILTPADYGTIGILNVFIAIAAILIDSGFGQALLQKGNPSKLDYSSVFYFNIALSTFLYFVFFFTLPFISDFFGDVRLTEYGRLLFITMMIDAVSIVQNTKLQEELNFKYLSIIQVISAVISGIIGVYLAYSGYGIISLVYHSISLSLSKTLLLILLSRWTPMLSFSFKSIKQIFSFGMSLLSTNLIRSIFNNIYTIVIGKVYSPTEVGYYNQANRFHNLSGNTFVQIVINVTFPALIKIRDDIVKLKNAYKKIMQLVVLILSPMMFLFILVSNDMFILLLTDKWISAAPYFQLLCIYGLTLPLHLINVNILKVFGYGKSIFMIELFRRLMLIIAIIITINRGVSTLLIGQILAMLPIIIISMSISGKYINYRFTEQMKDLIPFYAMSFSVYLISYSLFSFFSFYSITWTVFISKLIIYLLLYTIGVLLFYPNLAKNVFAEIKQLKRIKR